MIYLYILATFIWGFLFGAFVESRFNKRDILRIIKQFKKPNMVWEK